MASQSLFLQDIVQYVETKFNAYYHQRWRNVGFLACFIGGFQVIHVLATRFLVHMKR